MVDPHRHRLHTLTELLIWTLRRFPIVRRSTRHEESNHTGHVHMTCFAVIDASVISKGTPVIDHCVLFVFEQSVADCPPVAGAAFCVRRAIYTCPSSNIPETMCLRPKRQFFGMTISPVQSLVSLIVTWVKVRFPVERMRFLCPMLVFLPHLDSFVHFRRDDAASALVEASQIRSR